MYGLKYESTIFRLRHPKTNIGRHTSNHVTLAKSLKISRFHAVISFHDNSPLIKDMSEWGVFLNNTPIGKNRWAELKLGDVVALGALTVEDGGRILEVVSLKPEVKEIVTLESSSKPEIKVASTIEDGGHQSQVKITWESNLKNSATQKRIEIIDITEKDGDDVIDISDDESKVRNGSCASLSQLLSTCRGISKTEVVSLSDAEDEVIFINHCESKKSVCDSTSKCGIPMNKIIVSTNDTKATSSNDELILVDEAVALQSEAKLNLECIKLEIPSVINKTIIPSHETKYYPASSKFKTFSMNKTIVSSNETLPNPTLTKAAPVSEKIVLSNKTNLSYHTSKVETSPIKQPVISSSGTGIAVNAIQSTKCLSEKTSFLVAFNEQSLAVPEAFQSILNYSSDEEEYSCINNTNNLTAISDFDIDKEKIENPLSGTVDIKQMSQIIIKNEKNDVKYPIEENTKKVLRERYLKSKQDSNEDYKSSLSVFSSFYDENEENDAASSNSLPSTSEETSTAPIIHKTLLTNKIAKIAVISPLPSKNLKRKKRMRSESPESIYECVAKAELASVSSVSPLLQKLKNDYPRFRQKGSISAALSVPKIKNTSCGHTVIPAVTKRARKKMKTLYPASPVKEKKTPKIRPQPVVKVTDKNRGDFLTRLDVNNDAAAVTPNEPAPSLLLSTPTTLKNQIQKIQPQPSPSVTNTEHVKTIDEILKEIDVPSVSIDNNFNEIIPSVISESTVEVCVNFAKVQPLKKTVSGSTSKLIGESILKKSANGTHSVEKKKVTFRNEIMTRINDSDDRFYGRNLKSSKNAMRFNCWSIGHMAVKSPRPVICFNCKKIGHKATDCTFSCINLTKSKYRNYRKSFDDDKKRKLIRDPRLRKTSL